MIKKGFIITPGDVEKEALAQGISRKKLDVPPVVILTFNRAILEELASLCSLKEWEWAGGKYNPFFSLEKGWKGVTKNIAICVFFPPMGASPLASLAEDLIYFGAKSIFLLCASWGLGKDYLAPGQMHLPSFACGLDGTSPHYGNEDSRVEAEPRAFGALSHALDVSGIDWKTGGVGSCEAFYRITREIMDDFRKKGCLSMENGEVAALYSVAKIHSIPIGVLLQPYIDLEQGWKISYMGEKYRGTCKLQARVALEAARELL